MENLRSLLRFANLIVDQRRQQWLFGVHVVQVILLLLLLFAALLFAVPRTTIVHPLAQAALQKHGLPRLLGVTASWTEYRLVVVILLLPQLVHRQPFRVDAGHVVGSWRAEFQELHF